MGRADDTPHPGGRPRKHANEAERAREYRKRKRRHVTSSVTADDGRDRDETGFVTPVTAPPCDETSSVTPDETDDVTLRRPSSNASSRHHQTRAREPRIKTCPDRPEVIEALRSAGATEEMIASAVKASGESGGEFGDAPPRQRGRRRQYADDAARQRAWRGQRNSRRNSFFA